MKTHSNSRKLLAVLCTLAMLASLLMSFGISVSAALDDLGSCGFENGQSYGPSNNRAWGTGTAASNNTVRANGADGAGTLSMTRENKPGQGQGGSDYVAVATYGDNLGTATGTLNAGLMRDPAAGRLSTDQIDTVSAGTKYRISFYYQVKNLPEGTDADIKFIIASRNWSYKAAGRDYGSVGGAFTAATITSSTTKDQWIQASVDFTPTTDQGFHVAVIPTDNRYRSGMEIWLDAFTISIVSDTVSEHTVTFHGCGATWQDSTTSVTDASGTEVSVANPARDGYTFLGWYDAATGGNKLDPVTIPEEADLDVYAQWELNDTYVANADTQTFEEATDFDDLFDDLIRNNRKIYLDNSENHTRAGSQSLRIDVMRAYNSQLGRPRFILKNGDSTSADNFIAEDGESYRVTFWIKSTAAMDTSLALYVAAMDPDTTALSNSAPAGKTNADVHTLQTMTIPGATMESDNSIGNAKATMSLSAGEWTKVVIDIDTFVGFGGADSVVALGIADSKSGSYTANVVHHSLYIDDISIVKKSDLTAAAAALDYQSFENVDAGTDVDVRHKTGFTAEVVDDGISHNTGKADANGKAVKISQTANNTGTDRVQMYVTDANGNNFAMQNGKRYSVSFWVYAKASTPGIRFWLAPGDGTNAITADKDNLKVCEIDDKDNKLEPTVWRQYTVVTDATNVNGDSSGDMLLGIAMVRTTGMSTDTFYIDDIAVTELGASAGVQTFEDMTLSTNMDQRAHGSFTAKVSGARAHSGTQSVKVSQAAYGDGQKLVQMFIGDSSSYNVGLTKELGKEYLVSFWVCADKNARITFWVAASDSAFTDSAEKTNYQIAEESGINLSAGEWQCITVKTNATPADAANDREEKLLLGIRATQAGGSNTSTTNTITFYLDDIAVTKVEDAYTLPSGNVALYTNHAAGGVHTYTKGGEPRSAFRVMGGYTINGDDYASAVLNAANYTVVERGIILANATIDEANLTLTSGDADILKIQSKTEDLDQCWGDEDGVIKYSLLVSNVSAANADRGFVYRTYIKVKDSFNTEILLYSNVSGEVSLNTVATACGTSISWS